MKIGDVAVVCAGLSLAAGLAGCSGNASDTAAPRPAITVRSPAFADGAAIPKRYACARQGGRDVSPPLTWSGVPGSARELAIVVDDPDAPGGSYIHWIMLHIPTSATGVSEGDTAGEVVPGSGGKPVYAGPCPPGGVHHYHFIVYALRDPITPGHAAKAVHQQLRDAAIASGETIGTWHN